MKVFVADYGSTDMYRDASWWNLLTADRHIFANLELAKKFVENSQPKDEWDESEEWNWYNYTDQKELKWCYSTEKDDEVAYQTWIIMEVEVQANGIV